MKCDNCDQDMSSNTTITCRELWITFPDGKKWHKNTHHFNEPSGRCHDCNIKHGGFHHNGCDVERCPKCEGQLISCGCMDVDEKGGSMIKPLKTSDFEDVFQGHPKGTIKIASTVANFETVIEKVNEVVETINNHERVVKGVKPKEIKYGMRN